MDGLILLSQPSKLLPNLGQYLFKCIMHSRLVCQVLATSVFLRFPCHVQLVPAYRPFATFATFLLKSSHWLLLPLIRFLTTLTFKKGNVLGSPLQPLNLFFLTASFSFFFFKVSISLFPFYFIKNAWII